MTKKDICKKYIDINTELNEKETLLANALGGLNEDNSIIGIIPPSYQLFLNELFVLAVGESNQDWTDYWLYECNCEEANITIHEKDYIVTNFDELWILVGED